MQELSRRSTNNHKVGASSSREATLDPHTGVAVSGAEVEATLLVPQHHRLLFRTEGSGGV